MRPLPFLQAYKAPIAVLLALVLALGGLAYRQLTVALFPEVTFPQVKVIADVGLAPTDRVMVTVTKPLEDAMKQVPGLRLLRSTTSRGSCEISAFLSWGVDVVQAQQFIESRLNQARGNLPATINITVERMNPAILPVMGYTLEAPGHSALELRRLALYTIKPFLSQVEGVAAVQVQGGRTKEYEVELLPTQLAALGLGPDDVQTALNNTNQLLNIRLRYPQAAQATLDQMRAEPVFLPNGQRRRLDELATVAVTPSSAELERENLQAMTAVTARLDGRDLGSAMQEIQQKIQCQVPLPPGYFIQYGGSYAEQQSFQELLIILATACLLVFAVGLFLFKDLKAAGLILLVAILGPAGGSLALYLTGTPLNVGSYTGLIMVVGIIGGNAIFTFQQFNDFRAEGGPVEAAIGYAIAARLRPKLMTALLAIVALLPLALGIGAGRSCTSRWLLPSSAGCCWPCPCCWWCCPACCAWPTASRQQPRRPRRPWQSAECYAARPRWLMGWPLCR